MSTRVVYRSRFGVASVKLFDFHASPDAFTRLVPPWEVTRLISRTGGLEEGARTVIETRLAPGIWSRWEAVHTRYVPGVEFVDEAAAGPFSSWRHLHRVEPDGDDASWLVDDITYALPLGALGNLVAGRFVRARLDRMFAYRHHATARALGTSITAGFGHDTPAP